MSAEMTRAALSAPVNVTWEITLSCNLQCVHCLSDAGQRNDGELTRQECLRLVDQLARMRVFQVNIGGGEPFLRPDFFEILEYAHEKGMVTCVSTNGMMVDDALARRLARMEMLYLQVSLDGATADVNDPIRGEGTYRRILASMEALSRQGVPFSINVVLTRPNYPQLDQMIELARVFDSELRISRFRPSGRGKVSKKELGPTKEQLESFSEWLAAHDLVRTGDSFFCLTSESRRRKGLDMCGAAKMTCCIDPEGRLYPCAFLQEPPFRAGSFRDGSLRKIWNGAQVFERLRSLRVESCLRCARFEICRGGCPAVAYHTYEDLSMPDPECLMNLRDHLKTAA